MELLRSWFLGVTGAAMVGVFALAVTPRGAVRNVTQIAAALLLVIAVLRPLVGWNGIPELWPDGLAVPAGGPNAAEEILSSIIADKTAAYIVNKAQAVGLVVSVTARCRMGDGYPEPWAVTIRSERPEHAKSALGRMIETDLGIPPERQTYIQKGGDP
jgi:hypothetical protein